MLQYTSDSRSELWDMLTENSSGIKFVTPRPTIEIHLPDGRAISGPRGAAIGEFLKPVESELPAPVICAIVNGELRELTLPIKIDSYVTPITMSDPDGARIYRRSLVFLLESAFDAVFPGAVLTVDHSVASGGYYCQVSGHPPLSQEELNRLSQYMQQLVQADLPFQRKETPLSETIEYFAAKGADDQVSLLKHRQKNYLTLYQLGEFRDYHHGYMVPSTGFLRWFKLILTGDGFTLRFPRRNTPTQLLPVPEYPKLLATFRRYGDWLQHLGISNVGALNNAIQAGRAHEVILVSEALHEQEIAGIAAQIAERRHETRVVFIAGPSSSGKTTFSRRLSIQLLARGISPFPLEMDNYFVDRDRTPLDENGELNYESVEALDHARLSDDLRRLSAGEAVTIPSYNFITGRSAPGKEIHLRSREIIILEGIHGLNPALSVSIPRENTFRIYVSALTQLNLDRHNRVSTTDTRLIRRIVRDARERGYSALQTIQRWESVRRGEKLYIFPFQENADVMFNSALVYEVSVLKALAEPLLRQVPFGKAEYVEAKRLLAFLQWFLPLAEDLVPDNSIMREFIGNSILRDFTLWHNHVKS